MSRYGFTMAELSICQHVSDKTCKSSQFDKTVILFWYYIIINILFSKLHGILGGHFSFKVKWPLKMKTEYCVVIGCNHAPSFAEEIKLSDVGYSQIHYSTSTRRHYIARHVAKHTGLYARHAVILEIPDALYQLIFQVITWQLWHKSDYQLVKRGDLQY